MARIFLSLLLLSTLSFGARQSADADAVRVWEKVLAAKGGKDHLHEIENVLRSSQTSSNVRRVSYVAQTQELFVFPSRFWYWDDERPSVLGLGARSVDFTTQRAYSAGPRRRLPNDPIPDTEYLSESVADRLQDGWRLELMQAVELLETRWMTLRPVRTWTETKKGTVISILVECKFQMSEGWATGIFTLDSESYLPKQLMLNRPLINDHTWKKGFEFLDHRVVNGIQMPTTIRHFGDDPKSEEKVQYQFNLDYDPKIFERGPRIEDGPQGWQKRQ